MKLEERDQLADFQVAQVAPAQLGQELIERDPPPGAMLNRLAEHDGIDRRQSQVGEEPRLGI